MSFCTLEVVHTEKKATWIKVTYHIHSLKEKNYIITLLDAEKVFDNIKHSSIVWKDSSNYECQWTSLKWLRVSTES